MPNLYGLAYIHGVAMSQDVPLYEGSMMGTQRNISKKDTRQMLDNTKQKSKPFRTRVNGYRNEWVWEGDMMVVKRVRKA